MNDDTWQLVKHTQELAPLWAEKKISRSISKADVENIINRIEVGEEAPRPCRHYLSQWRSYKSL